MAGATYSTVVEQSPSISRSRPALESHCANALWRTAHDTMLRQEEQEILQEHFHQARLRRQQLPIRYLLV